MTKILRFSIFSILAMALLPVADLVLAGSADSISMNPNPACDRWARSSTRHIATDTVSGGNIHVADLDGDGHPDVLTPDAVSAPWSSLKWHKNMGAGVFSASRSVTGGDFSEASHNPTSIQAVDLDGDGDLDVLLALNGRNDKIVWYENLRGGLLWASRDIATANEASSLCVRAADGDGDGDLDVFLVSDPRDADESRIAWHENLGRGTFSPERIIARFTDVLTRVKFADLDGDGDPDVILASRLDDGIFWYENLGKGGFSSRRVITMDLDRADLVHEMDLDGDGDIDVLSASGTRGELMWYENSGGGEFSPQRVIDADARNISGIRAVDVDGDGDRDVLSTFSAEDSIAWYENLGGEAFSSRRIIETDVQNFSGIRAADLDGDGDTDVLTTYPSYLSDDSVAWYENLGSGAFSPSRIIATGLREVSNVGVTDLDSDGDLDVLFTSYIGLGHSGQWDVKVVWYENLGFETFSPQRDLTARSTIGANAIGDLDGDGDFDVLLASNNANEGKIVWHENQGGGEFASRLEIIGEATSILGLHLSDLDGDGDPDLLSSSADDDQIVWRENLGSEFSQRRVIATDSVPVHDVFAADLDGDGDLDALSASVGDGGIAWYENRGSGERWLHRMVASDADTDNATSVSAADLDGDADADVLAAYDPSGQISFYENLGDGEFSPRRDITADTDNARGVHLADLDGDNDLDVLSLSIRDNRIIWYENAGGGSFLPQRDVAAYSDGATSVRPADLDGDGDLDLLWASADDDKIAWYSNQGEGRFSPQRLITTDADRVGIIRAADLDGDSDLDVLWTSSSDGKNAWFENLGGGEFASHRAIARDFQGTARRVIPADLDGDGDVDVLSQTSHRWDNTIAWLENLGNGEFSSGRHIALTARRAAAADMADLDGDGDLDVLLDAAQTDGIQSIHWFENQGGRFVLSQQVHSADSGSFAKVRVTDLDGDGDLDVVSSSSEEGEISWFEYDREQGIYSSPQVLVSDLEGLVEFQVADMNGDSDLDLLSMSAHGRLLSWHENLGIGEYSPQRAIESDADRVGHIFPADLDGDGDLDVLSASEYPTYSSSSNGTIVWYENRSGGVFSPRREIVTYVVGGIGSVHAADLDGDGDLDVLSASSRAIAWSENLGGGEFSPKRIITMLAEYGPIVSAADMDGDGDLDVLSGSSSQRTIVWYENAGDGIFSSHRVL